MRSTSLRSALTQNIIALLIILRRGRDSVTSSAKGGLATPPQRLLVLWHAGFRLSNPALVILVLHIKKISRTKIAERVGFEPSKGVNPYRFSRAAPSTTQPPLHIRIVLSCYSNTSDRKCYNFGCFRPYRLMVRTSGFHSGMRG